MRNPWMSMYLSAANSVAGTARSQIMAEARRQQAAAAKMAASQITDFWLGSLTTTPKPKRKPKPKS